MGPHTIHLWSIDLDASENPESPLGSILTRDERTRAERFVFPKHRRRWIAARQALRSILGSYLDESPEHIRFAEGEHGKPKLSSQAPDLHFNLSHSGCIGLVAVTKIGAIGVDVEKHEAHGDLDLLAQRNFSANEEQTLASMPQNRQIPAFFDCWTRKEAYIKALGCGLSYPLDAFDVAFGTDEPARILSIENDTDRAQRWSLFDLDVPAGFSAALAIHSTRVEEIEYFAFPASTHPQKSG